MEIPRFSFKDIQEIGKTPNKLFRSVSLTAVLAFSLFLACRNNNASQSIVDREQAQFPFTQCGGEIAGQRVSTGHSVFVLGQRIDGSFNAFDLGTIGGQCGNTYPAPDDMVHINEGGTPVSLGTTDGKVYYYNRTYSQLGGVWGAMYFDPKRIVIVDEFQSDKGEVQYSAGYLVN